MTDWKGIRNVDMADVALSRGRDGPWMDDS